MNVVDYCNAIDKVVVRRRRLKLLQTIVTIIVLGAITKFIIG